MRTKTIEKKRYSLRGKRGIPLEERDKSEAEKVKQPTTKTSTPKQKSASVPVTGSTKRKNGKPERTLTKEELTTEQNISQTEIEAKKPKTEQEDKTDGNVSLAEQKTGVNDKTKEEEDSPVYCALQHAISCSVSTKQCTFPKCSIAKQFLAHCSSCNKKSEDCTICKAMDIMVCKHAQICNVPLEKCCSIPSCDKVRLMVLEEWVKLKHKHNEMMQRVFRGVIHAKKCKNKDCDLLLCKNVKSVLLHTHHCEKNDDCKTKKFIIQLCEHHHLTCNNEHCDVEFCVEIMKRRKAELINISSDNQEDVQTVEKSVFSTINEIDTSNRYQNNNVIPSVNGSSGYLPMFPSSFAPWPPNFQQNQQLFYPNGGMVFPFAGLPHQVSAAENVVEENSGNNGIDNVQQEKSIFENLPSSQDHQVNVEEANGDNQSPTEDMYYQFWRGKDEYNRNTLPRLSPNELQTIFMSRGDEPGILSPVTDHRVTYPEIQTFSQQDASSRSSQESELEENPLPTNRYESALNPLSNNQVSHAVFFNDNMANESYEQLKNQSDWSKIDFVKQEMFRQGLDVDTETADESDSDGLHKGERNANFANMEIRPIPQNELTQLERNYLNNIKV